MTTREWWEKASPRERDCKIAEVIFGWSDPIEVAPGRSLATAKGWYTVYRVAPRTNGIGFGFLDGAHMTRDGTKVYCGQPFSAWAPPHYTSDISAAFQVVEKMRERGYTVEIHGVSELRENPWDVFFYCEATGTCGRADGKELPSVAGLAALLAVEGKR